MTYIISANSHSRSHFFQLKIRSTLIVLLLATTIYITSAKNHIPSISASSKKTFNLHVTSSQSNIDMLRQRKTEPVKKALRARGGNENENENDNDKVNENQNETTNTINPTATEEVGSTNDVQPVAVATSMSVPAVTEAKTAIDEHTASRLRAAVFPIYGAEVKKFLLMGAIKFFVIMALTLTRDTKDTLVVTQCGAEAIAFLKVSGVWRGSCHWPFRN